MKKFFILSVFLFFLCLSALFAQSNRQQIFNDSDAAQQYVVWIRGAIEDGRFTEAKAAVNRAVAYNNVSSDISFLAAFVFSKTEEPRPQIIKHLDTAIEVNRWAYYSESEALVLKAEQLVAMRRYETALSVLDRVMEGNVRANADTSMLPHYADAVMTRLKAARGLALVKGGAPELAYFHSLMNSTLSNFSRDPRPARIFLEYAKTGARNSASDLQILDLIMRRLPILMEYDPDLAWMASPFIRNTEEARRYVASYRAGGLQRRGSAGFRPDKNCIPAALNFGLINDFQAVEELFYPLEDTDEVSLDLEAIKQTYSLLRGEDGRDVFTQALLSFKGFIYDDIDNDGIIDSSAFYNSGIVNIYFDKNQENAFDFVIVFSGGEPLSAQVPVAATAYRAQIQWERYPFVESASLADDKFNFRPADFQFAPVSFVVLGGSKALAGVNYPVLINYAELTRRSLVSFCSSIQRPSVEFGGATEIINLEKGIPRQAVEFMGRNIIAIAEFERGAPVIQYIDLDLDGRMETIRRFHRPGVNFPWPESDERFDYRKLISSSESDWTGEGRYKTGEVYLQDGSVVYKWDMDGSGEMNYEETKK